MHIQLNGERREFASELTVSELVDQLALTGRRIAVEVNEEIVPRSQHAETRLTPGDCVEIVHAIGGG
ncbi:MULTISPECIES: sulfur carrier protein ThiS [Chromohalobacter]|uniref:Sulfur carrier protein ThiS n=1 Tax=Chromohalobacter israelensis (strain ATCC BAA-138 / DSM 3043 / CIP 106854 / NCIMB 13768 / 1H11) TaxID=290398 RepID=Q1QSR7_CHRI1|nr:MULTISPECIES: sulfur carrier protein ThiS [Chromohalobacter]ABE60491.1 sulfur carrier protein ThiS [Chromohalobacter salexigens DSM 3043]MBZ5874992.1 sulfur carrier protein ThiS [Chromohalobacter salexigens]MDO0945664.1 sulfur carrier protein ThiS [Chromohalobacter salexigens]NQY46411.1 sulfur carrier protein ThiS [Chromohalobacter sp.]NWO57604.1 sulfur carrier protein ThiS [Chromohalobacter salexigens]